MSYTFMYVIHGIAIVAALALHQPVWHGRVIADHAQRPPGFGHGLVFVYAMWLLAASILYVPCLRFMELRSRH
jgi:hypothetical protein